MAYMEDCVVWPGDAKIHVASRRPESRIAVVSHCGFIFLTLSAFGHECAHSVQEEMHRGFDNCEMRSMIITDAAGGGRFNNSWFPGGRECLRK